MIQDRLRRFFIPSEHNDYTPHILQKTAMGVMLFLVLISFAVSNVQALLMMNSHWFISTILPSVIVDLTNDNRSGERLDLLTRSPVLDEAARQKAEHMARYGYFAHTSPDGVTPWYWFAQAGYAYSHAGENLAVHFTDSKEVVDAWMESPGHRANILDNHYTEIGIGTAQGTYKGYQTVFVVQMFGRPAAPRTPLVASPTQTPVPPQGAASLALAGDTDVVVQGVQADEPHEENGQGEEDDIVFTPEGPVLYLGEMSTTSGSAPADIATSPERAGASSFLNRLATQPVGLLTIVYSVLGMFVVVCLVLSIAIEWRHQRPVQIAYGAGLLALMAVMWYVEHSLVAGALVT